jgi:hypothetical protein
MRTLCSLSFILVCGLFATQRHRIDFDLVAEYPETSNRTISLSGTAFGGDVAKIEWRTSAGRSGIATATSQGGNGSVRWTTGPILLQPGDNEIAITVLDATRHASQRGIHVFRTSADPRPDQSGVLDWIDGRQLPYQIYGDLLVVDGCIEIGSARQWLDPNRKGLPQALANPTAGQRWTGNTIPYLLDPGLTPAMRETFAQARAHWENKTPIRFVVRTNQANYIRVTRTDNPISTAGGVGMIGGEQIMRLREEVGVTTHIHEIGHTVGLFHEQNRIDRGRFITIDYSKIRKDEFRQVDAFLAPSIIGGYDMQSIMHYDKNNVTRYGERILDTIPPGMDVANDQGLSAADIDAVLRMYGAFKGQTTIATNPPGLSVVVDGETMSTPATLDWPAGSQHTIEAPETQGSGARVDRFARWSHEGDRSQTITASADLTTFVANYVPHCLITLAPPTDPAMGFYTITPYAADGYYPCDSEVTLSATVAEGVKFLDWTAPVGQTNPRTFRVLLARDIRPNFTRGQTITFRSEPSGLPLRINAGNFVTPRTFATQPGNLFNVDAFPQQAGTVQYRFSKWSQGGNAAQAIRVTGTDSIDVTVTYAVRYYASAEAIPAGAGTVTMTPAAADGFYDSGTTVELRATAGAGRVFRGWSDDLAGNTNATASLKVDENRYTEANFRVAQAPTVTAFTPSQVVAGSGSMLLFVAGTGFNEVLSHVFVNGKEREAKIVDFNNIYFSLTRADLAAAGNLSIRVSNSGVADVAAGTRNLPVNAAPAGCAYAVATDQVAAGASFGSYAVALTAGAAGCPWFAESDSSWLTAAGSLTGAGDGVVMIWTQPNPSSEPRSGVITAGGQAIRVDQAGASCDYTVTAGTTTIPAEGGPTTLQIRTYNRDCKWSIAGTLPEWLQSEGDASGVGNLDLKLTAAPNSGAEAREAELIFGQTTVKVRQDGTN